MKQQQLQQSVRSCVKQHASRRRAAAPTTRCTTLALPADECAGVTTECLNADLKAGGGPSSCKPLADGAPCGAGKGAKTCLAGICGGLWAWKQEQQNAEEARAEQQAEKQSEVLPGAKKPLPKPAPPAPAKPVNGWANFSAAVHPESKVGRRCGRVLAFPC